MSLNLTLLSQNLSNALSPTGGDKPTTLQTILAVGGAVAGSIQPASTTYAPPAPGSGAVMNTAVQMGPIYDEQKRSRDEMMKFLLVGTAIAIGFYLLERR